MYLGRQSQEGSNPHEVSRDVAQVINHPAYDGNTFNNDMSLLRLSAPVSLTTYIQPVCLAAPGSTFYADVNCWVTGWGNIRSQGGLDRRRSAPVSLSDSVSVKPVRRLFASP